MTVKYVDTLRTTWTVALGNAAGSAAKLLICSGTRPVTKGSTTPTPLATFTCGAGAPNTSTGFPFFASVTNGVGTATAIAPVAATAGDAGTAATWARLTTSANVFVADLDVTVTNGGGEVTLDYVTIVGPAPGPPSTVTITSLTITAPGA